MLSAKLKPYGIFKSVVRYVTIAVITVFATFPKMHMFLCKLTMLLEVFDSISLLRSL